MVPFIMDMYVPPSFRMDPGLGLNYKLCELEYRHRYPACVIGYTRVQGVSPDGEGPGICMSTVDNLASRKSPDYT